MSKTVRVRAGRRMTASVGLPPLEKHAPAHEESFHFEQLADITGVDVVGGEVALDGCWLILNVRFATHGAPDGKRWEIWPQEANVEIVKISDPGARTRIGAFRAPLTHSMTPAMHSHKSDSVTVPFYRHFSPLELTAIEQWRGGQDLKLNVNVSGFGKRGTQTTWSYFRQHDAIIPRSKWMDMLANGRFQEHVHVAVSVKGDRRLQEGGNYLRAAIDHHARGDYSGVAQTCRKALEEIGKAGFGKKAPADVAAFIQHESTKKYTLEERVAVVQMAALILLHSGAHAGEEERRWCRSDADLALAMVATLLQIAPSRLVKAETISNDALGG